MDTTTQFSTKLSTRLRHDSGPSLNPAFSNTDAKTHTSRNQFSFFVSRFSVFGAQQCASAMANEIEVVELLDSSEDEAAPMEADDVEVRVVDAEREIRAPEGAAGAAADDDEIVITGTCERLLAPLHPSRVVLPLRIAAPFSTYRRDRTSIRHRDVRIRYDSRWVFP